MEAPRQGPNPLRPYYIPPSIGETVAPAANATASASKAPASSSSFTFPDIDYSEYIPDGSPSVTGSLKSLLDQAVWKYTSVLMAQPFEVAKVILQVRVAQESDLDEPSRSRQSSTSGAHFHEAELEDSSDEEPNFFTNNSQFGPSTPSPPRGRRGRPPPTRTTSQRSTGPSKTSGSLELRNSHSLLDALSSLSSNSGALSIWRATNTTFIHTILSRTLETFFRSFLAALFGVAEQDVLIASSSSIPDSSVLSSIAPTATVLIATAAASLSALVLAPVDAARTRLILTPSTDEPRTLLGTLRTLSPSYLIPAHLIPITVLTSSIPTFLSNVTPFFLRSYLGLDPAMNSASWSVATFASSALDLSIKFPLETVLRRAQIVTWTAPSVSPPRSASKHKAVNTVVPVPQSYRGVLPTMWGIVRDEGYSESQKDKTAALMGKAPRRKRKGQGVQGLYRGWRVGLWGLVGIWGTGFVGGLQGSVEAGAGVNAHAGKF
ncbi:uncharacterized protein HMPREF1541_00597 [Cyphellophora europaea CBS 101466]|uniref:Mitochondrial fusion protein n=1 Tax=Cyphellophora europaea (strain CBS 101466) TaxID=1220924 RepID=W2SEH2_CYPE1|nr:uncharacterized protein HMPREF1541_00597 [Cyphellophora europaea CBS 101466]ETN46413.1 hypothetical protein HMPREF1541_00597 [Cyphellophora europaea CBS 101466]